MYPDGTTKILPKKEMFLEAEKAQLHLILVNHASNPPVIKLINYDLYSQEQSKLRYQNSKKHKYKPVQKIKSIILKLKIDIHDLNWKVKKAQQWLLNGEKVQLIIKAPRNASSSKSEYASQLFNKFKDLVKDFGKESEPLKEINKTQYSCLFIPDHKKEKIIQSSPS